MIIGGIRQLHSSATSGFVSYTNFAIWTDGVGAFNGSLVHYELSVGEFIGAAIDFTGYSCADA